LDEIMKLRTIAAAALIAAFATPALAADEFFVVQDAKT
jgi:cbb3-type cytochrome oxidase subunit 1